MSLREWIRDVSMTDVGTLITQLLWIIGSLCFTWVAASLMLSDKTHAESHHMVGFNLALALLTAWTGKSAIGGFSHWGNRTTSREYMEHKAKVEEAKASRKPPVVEAPGGTVSVPTTAERPALAPVAPAPVVVQPAPPVVGQPGGAVPSDAIRAWRAPSAGGSEPNIWTDDERGD